MTSFRYREQPSSARLSLFVECFWSVETLAATNITVPPDGCVDVVFSPDFGLRVVGAMTAEQIFSLNAETRTVGVRFRPGMARTILEAPVADLTDSFIQLEDLRPRQGKELKSRLAELTSVAQRVAALSNFVQLSAGQLSPVHYALEAISCAHGNVHLDSLARQSNLSSRQFRRRCREEAGLTPKHLCRILRFRRAGQLARLSPNVNWAKIAAETGYFDQAHLIRDFQEFTGRTPMSVLSNTQTAAVA